MLNRYTTRLGIISILLIGFVLGYIAANQPAKLAEGNQGATESMTSERTAGNAETTYVALRNPNASATEPNSERDVYYPVEDRDVVSLLTSEHESRN